MENEAAGTHESRECWTPPENPDDGNPGEFGNVGDTLGEQDTSFGWFIEIYDGCSEAFPGGKSFMDYSDLIGRTCSWHHCPWRCPLVGQNKYLDHDW